ncbi:uncharacterized protein [Diadema antillarum]|uniref:uncharacterized protein n=1 Tax=Diadema antillarum TaxID=105358 RepID=UPI003A8C3F95
MSTSEEEEEGAPTVWQFLLWNEDHNTIATCFLSESKAVGERLLAHNASDKDKRAVARFMNHTGAMSIQAQVALEESRSKLTGASNVCQFLLRNGDHNTIAAYFLSECEAVGERLLAHNASDEGE